MDSFSENLQYITKNVESQFEGRLQEFDNAYDENMSWLETVSKDYKTAFESTIERIFLAEKKTKAKQTRELFTPLKEFNYSAPDRAALSRQLATPASVYRPRTRATSKQQQVDIVANKENQVPIENKVEEKSIVEEIKKPIETKKAPARGKKVLAAVEKMEEKIVEERFGKKKVEEKPIEKPVEEPKKEEMEESEESDQKDDASEKEEEEPAKPLGRAGRLKATRTNSAAAKRAATAAKRAATLAEKKRLAREAEEQREKAEKEEQERLEREQEAQRQEKARLAAEEKEKKRLAKLEKEEKERQAKLEREKAEKEEKERLERERIEREEKEREAAKSKKVAEESENESEEEAPAPKKKKAKPAKKAYVKKTAARGRKRARAVESDEESEAQSASEEVPKPKAKKAKISNEKDESVHVVEDVPMQDVKKTEEAPKDEEDEVIVDVVGSATPAKRVALPSPAFEDAIMADLPLDFEESVEIVTTKTPRKMARVSIDSQDEVDVTVIKPKQAEFTVHEELESTSTTIAAVIEPLNTETATETAVEKENDMQIDAENDSVDTSGPSSLADSSEDASKAEKKQKKVGFAAASQPKSLASSNSQKALDVNDKLKRAADNRQMLEQKKREELEKKRAQALSKVEAGKKAREESLKKTESVPAKKADPEEPKEEEVKKTETVQKDDAASKEEDAQTRRKRWLVQSLEEKKHNASSRDVVEAAPKPQGPPPAPQGPKLSLLAFLKKPSTLTVDSTTTTGASTAAVSSDPEDSESGSEKDMTTTVDLKSASSVIPKPTTSAVPKPQSSFSDLRKFIRDGSDEPLAAAAVPSKPTIVAPTPVVPAPAPVAESKPLPSASNFGFKQISRENSSNSSGPATIKSISSVPSTGPSSLAPPSLNSVQSQIRDAQLMPPPQSPSSVRSVKDMKAFIPIKLTQSPKASPHSPQVLSPKPSASMLYSPSPPRSPLRPRGFLDSPECQCPILDYCSDDDSDSDVDLPVPAWTQKDNLHKALEMQVTIDPDEIFGKELGKSIDLNAIFGNNPRRPAYKK